MSSPYTVIFADLSGSSRLFQSLGNVAATGAVTAVTQAIAQVCEDHGGSVVKNLGDGVLALFSDPGEAIDAAVQVQRDHARRLEGWPAARRMGLRIGVARGDIVVVDGDGFGEAVNLAARLCNLCSDGEVWAAQAALDRLAPPPGVDFRPLGAMRIRGFSGPTEVCQVDWRAVGLRGQLTEPTPLVTLPPVRSHGRLVLSWLDLHAGFDSTRMPIHLGRQAEADFAVSDPRVSRLHARIRWEQDHFVLTDLSSYGTWVRFEGGAGELTLRRGECVLVGRGEIALGAPFSDFTVPVIGFAVEAGPVGAAG